MLEKIRHFKLSYLYRNNSVQNFLYLGLIQGTNVLISIISVPLIIQRVGVDQFGLVSLALSVITSLNIVVGFGYNFSGPREASIHRHDSVKLSNHFSLVLYSKLCIVLLLLVGIFFLIQLTSAFEEYRVILAFSTIILIAEAIQLVWFFQGIEKTKIASIVNVLSKLCYLLAIMYFIDAPDKSKYVNFIWGTIALGFNLGLVFFCLRQFQIHFGKPNFRHIIKSVRENAKLFFYNLISHVTVSGGIIILSFFEGSAQLGMYGLVEKVIITLRFFPSLVVSATFPKASHLFVHHRERFIPFLMKISLIGITVTGLISITAYLFSPEIVRFLAKSHLPDSILYLKILCFIPFLSSINIFNMMYFLTKDLQQLLIKSSVINSIFMLTTAAILTAMYGTIGLCMALICSEIFTAITCTIFRIGHSKRVN
ncbi:polysaccharide transporter, PST family [Algoriphagus locisalis]|uniref:Polysaccharide transporter, PST family n=1 Tax=Algoriphagus locisalis TaxID=305507 RepID=A0A1I7ASD2_9BACT|nr:oligosaccharide flippase family protein [Algoriphagus locisalis]SFT77793.1 polysaccharide transporter, PST family [Algoriphagus locisalis]